MTALRALIVGGSVAGLFAANLLRNNGWDVAVYERTAGDLGDRGTGIGTRNELFDVMRRIGLAVDASTGVEVRGRIGLNHDGTIALTLPTRAVNSAWSRIWRPLRRALPDDCYHGGKTLMRVEQDADAAVAVFDDGSQARGDLVVGADGLHSSVRAQLLPASKPRYAGYVAWRGIVDVEWLAGDLHELAFHHMLFDFPEGELLLSLPMPGPGHGTEREEPRCHFVWFRPVAEEALSALCTDATGKRHGHSIPPPLIRGELIETLKHDANALLAPQASALVHATPQIILQPIFDLESPEIVFGRVALVGDAAFVARPHVATGVMKAALDAQVLADALADAGVDLAAGLARYRNERLPYGAWLVARGRHIGGHFDTRGGHRMQRIEALMREYGAAGVVRGEAIAARNPHAP